jgi:hypothetical protein
MAYTRDWATEVLGRPLGSRDSDEIDDAMREFRVDLNERLTDILQDPAAFPWVLKIPGTGVDQSYNIRIPAAGGHIVSGLVFDPALGGVKPTSAGGSGKWVCSLQVPRTIHVKAAVFSALRASPGIVTAKIVRVSAPTGGAPTVTVLATDSASASLVTVQGIVLAGLDEELGVSNDLFFEVDITGDGGSADDTIFYAVDINMIPD